MKIRPSVGVPSTCLTPRKGQLLSLSTFGSAPGTKHSSFGKRHSEV